MNCATVYVGLDECCVELTKKKRKARIPHKCYECGKEIKSGSTYEYFTGIQDGEIFSVKTCESCVSVREVFFNGCFFGLLWEDLENHIGECRGEISESNISALHPTARARVCDFIETEWETRN